MVKLRRYTGTVIVLLALLLVTIPTTAQQRTSKAVPLKVEGDTEIVVKSLPCTVRAPEGGSLYDWTYPDDVRAESDKHLLTITSMPKGRSKIKVRILTVDFDKKIVGLDTGEAVVIYGGVPPEPDPGPKPPTPVVPDGPLGLTKVSREGAALVVSDNKQAEAKALADAHRAHAAAVAAGAFPSAAKILDGWREANGQALTEGQVKLWTPWRNNVKTRIEALHKGGSLPGNNEWSAAFREIADGLDGGIKKEKR